MQKSTEVVFRLATNADLPSILQLLADDVLGHAREALGDSIAAEYQKAFQEIDVDPNNELIVGELNDRVVAVLQITYIPNLTLKGTKRAQIEGVRVSADVRGQKIGEKLFRFAFERARQRGCRLAQLTTNKSRMDAIRFYESLGFTSTHEGMKLEI